MSDNLPGSADRDQRLEEVLLAYLEAAQAGWAPERRQLLAAYPDLRSELEEFFASHDAVERRAAPLRAAKEVGPGGGGSSTGLLVRPGDASPGAEAALGQLGDFRLLREIGRGGMGTVYEALQISLDRRVALKVLPFAAALDARQLQRFKKEAQAAAHLHHTNIVPVYAVGAERGVHFYAMQLIEGQNLAALIQELRGQAAPSPSRGSPSSSGAGPAGPQRDPIAAGAVSAVTRPVLWDQLTTQRSGGQPEFFRTVVRLVMQAAEALDYAHGMSVVHRDIKPANLLVDERGNLWITDFGLAQFHADVGLTGTGDLLGTLRYMSPEQAAGRRTMIDQRTDIYSLGATLYELLARRPLHDGTDRATLLHQILHDEPRPPRSVDRSIPVELETIILKAVAKEPEERYATAGELAADLRRFLEDRPVLARRPSFREQAWKWARRHRSLVTSLVGALLVSVAVLAAATVLVAGAYERERRKAFEAAEQRARADEERTRAEEERQRAEKNFTQAWEAVDRFAQIAAEELAGDPGMDALRRRLLEVALAYYRDFTEHRRSDDPSAREKLEISRAKVEAIIGELTTLMGAGRYSLLHHEEVQDELGLARDQREALARIRERWHKLFREADPEKKEQRRLALAQSQEQEVGKLLTSRQLRRFHQIALQDLGPNAFSDPDVVEVLQLTLEQRKQIRTCQEQARCPPGPPDARRREQLEDVKRRAREKIVSLLTPDQKRQWQELVGKPFAFKPPPGRPPGERRGEPKKDAIPPEIES
jgi:serine/threonine protein kinase